MIYNNNAIFLTKLDLHNGLINSRNAKAGNAVYPYYKNNHGKLQIVYNYGHAETGQTAKGDNKAFEFSKKDIKAIIKKKPNLIHNVFNLHLIDKFHLILNYQKQGHLTFVHVNDHADNSLFTIVGNVTEHGFKLTSLMGVIPELVKVRNLADAHKLTLLNFELQHVLHMKLTSNLSDTVDWFNCILTNSELQGMNTPVSALKIAGAI